MQQCLDVLLCLGRKLTSFTTRCQGGPQRLRFAAVAAQREIDEEDECHSEPTDVNNGQNDGRIFRDQPDHSDSRRGKGHLEGTHHSIESETEKVQEEHVVKDGYAKRTNDDDDEGEKQEDEAEGDRLRNGVAEQHCTQHADDSIRNEEERPRVGTVFLEGREDVEVVDGPHDVQSEHKLVFLQL